MSIAELPLANGEDTLSRRGERLVHKDYPDTIRTLGAAAVVLMHIAPFWLSVPEKTPSFWWWVANVSDAVCRWGVPVFIMLSGALLLDPMKSEDWRTFYRRRLMRVGLPMAFWTVFYLYCRMFHSVEVLTLRAAARAIVMGKPFAHMPFLFMIAGLYLFTPMFRVLLGSLSISRQLGTAALSLAVASIAFLCGMAMGLPYDKPAAVMFAPVIGYYLLGAVLAANPIPAVWRKAAWIGTLGSAAVVAVGLGLFKNADLLQEGYVWLWANESPVIIVMSVSVFLLFVREIDAPDRQDSAWMTVARWIAPSSLGIYLIHPTVISILLKSGVSFRALHPLVGIPIGTILVFAVSLVITKAIQQVPYMRRIVG